MPDNTVIVDRSGKGRFGNPFKIGKPGRMLTEHTDYALQFELTAEHTVRLYDNWLETGLHPLPDGLTSYGRDVIAAHMMQRRNTIIAALPTLRGRNLACFCKIGTPCHRDVLLRMANAEQLGT
jgi:hypothetical protein